VTRIRSNPNKSTASSGEAKSSSQNFVTFGVQLFSGNLIPPFP